MYASKRVRDEIVSFCSRAEPCSSLALMGRSGCGKTTAMREIVESLSSPNFVWVDFGCLDSAWEYASQTDNSVLVVEDALGYESKVLSSHLNSPNMAVVLCMTTNLSPTKADTISKSCTLRVNWESDPSSLEELFDRVTSEVPGADRRLMEILRSQPNLDIRRLYMAVEMGDLRGVMETAYDGYGCPRDVVGSLLSSGPYMRFPITNAQAIAWLHGVSVGQHGASDGFADLLRVCDTMAFRTFVSRKEDLSLELSHGMLVRAFGPTLDISDRIGNLWSSTSHNRALRKFVNERSPFCLEGMEGTSDLLRHASLCLHGSTEYPKAKGLIEEAVTGSDVTRMTEFASSVSSPHLCPSWFSSDTYDARRSRISRLLNKYMKDTGRLNGSSAKCRTDRKKGSVGL